MDVGHEASWFAMEAANEIKEEGTEVMPIAIQNPPKERGVEATRTKREIRCGMLVLW